MVMLILLCILTVAMSVGTYMGAEEGSIEDGIKSGGCVALAMIALLSLIFSVMLVVGLALRVSGF